MNVEDAFVEFRISVEIAAPPDVVWSVIADAEHWHEWTASVRSIRLLAPEPLRLGTRALVRQPRLPPAVWKVTTFDPGRSFTWKNGAPGMWVYAFHAVEPIGGARPNASASTGAAAGDDGGGSDGSGDGDAGSNANTRATLSVRFEGLFGRLLGRMTASLNNRYLAMEAAGLKQRSEERFRAARAAS